MTVQKFLAIAGQNWIALSNGFVHGQIGCMVSALQRKEDGVDFSEGQISLIASLLSISCTIGFVVVALLTDKIGRRWPYTLFSTTMIINWLTLYYARHMFQFIISRLIGGASVGALVALTIFVTPEYTDSNNRAFYLNMITTVAPAIGTTVAHVVGATMNWRHVSLFGIAPAVIGIIIPFCWVESPHWLASKGRFEECSESFRKIHGSSPQLEKELQLLIKVEKKKQQIASEQPRTSQRRILMILKKKYFWEPLVLSVILHCYLTASGKLVFTVLASVMLEQIMGSSNVMLYTLLVDGFLIIGACLSCYFITKTSLRNLLFATGFSANILLVLISVLFYFNNGEKYFDWIKVTLLALYFIIINAGPYPLIEALYGEIFPLGLKMYIFSISGSILMIAFSSSIFLFPFIVSAVGYHGFFLVNAGIMTVSLGCVWLRLPETKGKTLQEIEVYFKAKTFDIERVLNDEQSKALI